MRLRATRLTSIAQAGGQRTLIQRAIAVLRRFGSDAHVYLPGVGMLNGLQAANYIDSAGTQVGAVDQPVGLALDAAGGLGVELVVNGGFADATGWTIGANWAITGGQAICTSPSAGGRLQTAVSMATGKTYQVTFTVAASSAGNFYLQFSGGSTIFGPQNFSTPGDYNFKVAATANHALLEIVSNGGVFTGSIDNISVREVTFIAASQPTTASKPILRRGAVNLLTYSGDFSNAAWSKTAVTVSGSQLTTTNNNHSIPQAATVVASTAYTFVFYAKRGSMSALKYSVYNNTGGAEIVAPTTYYAQTNDTDYAAIVLQFTTPAGCTSVNVYPIRDSGATGTVFVQSAALFQGTLTAAQIQALGGIPLTTTAPASTALGSYFWQFDGSNDSLSLGGPLFQMADDHCVVAGALSESATGDRAIFSQRSSAATNPIVCGVDVSSGSPRAIWRDDAGLISILSGTVVSGAIIVAARSVANARVFRVNAVQKQAATLTLGSTSITSASIGVSPAASPVAYFSGAIYPVIAIKGTVPDADLLLLERFVGQMSGVSI